MKFHAWMVWGQRSSLVNVGMNQQPWQLNSPDLECTCSVKLHWRYRLSLYDESSCMSDFGVYPYLFKNVFITHWLWHIYYLYHTWHARLGLIIIDIPASQCNVFEIWGWNSVFENTELDHACMSLTLCACWQTSLISGCGLIGYRRCLCLILMHECLIWGIEMLLFLWA